MNLSPTPTAKEVVVAAAAVAAVAAAEAAARASRGRRAGSQPVADAALQGTAGFRRGPGLAASDSSDEKPSLPSLETQCLHCSEELSAVLIEASANTNGDCQKNMMLFSPVKRKRSKRVMPELDSEVCAASALLMLSGCASKGCYGGDNNDNISTPNLLKEVNLNASDQLVHCDEFMDNTRPNSDRNSAYEGFYELSEKENTLNLAADVPRTVVLENVFDDGLVDGHAEFMKPEADISLEEAKSSSNLSVAVNIKRYHCEVCGKLLRSECALDVHMRLHREKEKILNLVADIPKKEVLLNVFDHGPDVDAEFMKPGAGSSVEDLKSGDLSAAVKIKSYECKVCGKVLRSGQALGGHMTSHLNRGQENTLNLVADVPKAEVLLNVFDYELDAVAEFKKPGADISVEELKSSDLSAAVNVKRHIRLHYVRKCNRHLGVTDCPNSALMEEHMQKHELDSPIFCGQRPHSHGREV
nr:unnamed protein product [Digitaria exilis]